MLLLLLVWLTENNIKCIDDNCHRDAFANVIRYVTMDERPHDLQRTLSTQKMYGGRASWTCLPGYRGSRLARGPSGPILTKTSGRGKKEGAGSWEKRKALDLVVVRLRK
jgi:hypothetical protein